MKTVIFYYSGTGNSLWAARRLSEKLDGAELIHMTDFLREPGKIRADVAGLVFPVYIWGVPAPVVKFIQNGRDIHADYFFAVAVNGGQVSGTLIQLKKLMQKQGLTLSSGFEIKTPSNYIPWGGPGSREKIDGLIVEAGEKVSRISERSQLPPPKAVA